MSKILIVDDEVHNIFALKAVLKSRGYTIETANSVQEMFGKLAQGINVALILMDMMMPEIDGYEATQQLKQDERYRHIPVIAVTAQAMSHDRDRCLSVGASEYISKPIDVDKLLIAIKTCK
ncbi:response regulator [Olivibacter sitiensis]|uniref:response regulator n=1 Tax=Olivibacter sitiensis TaxID=376470 RepID=UPI0004075EC0|nr:response regulator [Olivibacter sitiensis]